MKLKRRTKKTIINGSDFVDLLRIVVEIYDIITADMEAQDVDALNFRELIRLRAKFKC